MPKLTKNENIFSVVYDHLLTKINYLELEISGHYHELSLLELLVSLTLKNIATICYSNIH